MMKTFAARSFSRNALRQAFIISRPYTAQAAQAKEQKEPLRTITNVDSLDNPVQKPGFYNHQYTTLNGAHNEDIRFGTFVTNSPISAFTVRVPLGAIFEDESNNGISYLIKHLILLGNTKSGKSFFEAFDELGAQVDISLERDGLTAQAQCIRSQTKATGELLLEAVLGLQSRVNQEVLEQAKAITLKEKERRETCVVNESFDHLYSIAYQTTNLGLPFAGSNASISNLSVQQVQEFVNKTFTRDRVVVGSAGSFNLEDVHQIVNSSVSGLAKKSPFSIVEPLFIGSMVTDHSDNLHYCVSTLGIRVCPAGHEDVIAVELLRKLIGDYDQYSGVENNSTTLLSEFVGKEKFANKFTAFSHFNQYQGLFGIQIHSNEKPYDAVCESLTEMVRLAQNARPNEVIRAKSALENEYRQKYDSVLNLSKISANDLFYGNTYTLDMRIAQIRDTSANDVRRVGTKYIYDAEVAAVGVGNSIVFPDYNMIRGWTNWWRL